MIPHFDAVYLFFVFLQHLLSLHTLSLSYYISCTFYTKYTLFNYSLDTFGCDFLGNIIEAAIVETVVEAVLVEAECEATTSKGVIRLFTYYKLTNKSHNHYLNWLHLDQK